MATTDPLKVLFSSYYSATGIPNAECAPGATFEAIVGEAFELRANHPDGAFTGAVTSAPGGSSAAWSSNSFTADVAGVYELRASNGSNGPVTFRLVAFPTEALEHAPVKDQNWPQRQPYSVVPERLRPLSARRLLLRQIARGAFGTFSDATYAALNASQPVPVGISYPR